VAKIGLYAGEIVVVYSHHRNIGVRITVYLWKVIVSLAY